ncbi:hypothetical protein F0310_05610 (plasmid) [Borrelia sp. A-FGy1]|uniref:hypothetical protein n=1 Tax=Borrelia sp. A-FGy1 TaxID=2608247 RepID=UPI0015F37AE0|nr:hypothetical protein [Borrelia sp. A-FGy1]QMU99885.1 hypothetical protein F0310_05610 [Borrelia sp. A-FGy1]
MRCNLFILLLVALLFVSCKFFGNSSSSKKADPSNISKLALDASSRKQDESTSYATGEDKKNETSTDMLADVLLLLVLLLLKISKKLLAS